MVRALICLILSCTYSVISWSQKDTLNFYLDSSRFKCSRDNAVYFVKQYKQKGKWIQENYAASSNGLNTIATFSDKACTYPEGIMTAYSEAGDKISSTDFFDGSAITKTFYYSSGAKKAFMSFVYNINKSWDENGNELNEVILEKDARPVGFSWLRYLQDSINGNIAAASKLPIGIYQVNATFVVDIFGNLTNVKAFSNTCPKCAEEAVRVISKSPPWEPAIRNNVRIPFATNKAMYFAVSDKQAGRVGAVYQILRIFVPH